MWHVGNVSPSSHTLFAYASGRLCARGGQDDEPGGYLNASFNQYAQNLLPVCVCVCVSRVWVWRSTCCVRLWINSPSRPHHTGRCMSAYMRQHLRMFSCAGMGALWLAAGAYREHITARTPPTPTASSLGIPRPSSVSGCVPLLSAAARPLFCMRRVVVSVWSVTGVYNKPHARMPT